MTSRFTFKSKIKHKTAPRPPSEHSLDGLLLPALRDDGTLVTMENVAIRECRFIYGDAPFSEAPMCGRQIKKGKYCEGHRARLYTKERPRV